MKLLFMLCLALQQPTAQANTITPLDSTKNISYYLDSLNVKAKDMLVNADKDKNLKSAFVRLNDSLDVEFTICNFKFVDKVSQSKKWDKAKIAKEVPCEIYIYNRKKGQTLRYLKKAK